MLVSYLYAYVCICQSGDGIEILYVGKIPLTRSWHCNMQMQLSLQIMLFLCYTVQILTMIYTYMWIYVLNYI